MTKSHRDRIIGATDELDIGLALLRTAYLATTAEGGVLQDDVEAINATLFQAVTKLGPVRKTLHEVTGEMPMVRGQQ